MESLYKRTSLLPLFNGNCVGNFIILASTLAPPLLNVVFKGQLEFKYFIIAFIGTLFSQILGQSAEIMRLLYRPWSYISITFTNSMLAFFVLVSVIVFDHGILGFFGGTISSLIVAITRWYRARLFRL